MIASVAQTSPQWVMFSSFIMFPTYVADITRMYHGLVYTGYTRDQTVLAVFRSTNKNSVRLTVVIVHPTDPIPVTHSRIEHTLLHERDQSRFQKILELLHHNNP